MRGYLGNSFEVLQNSIVERYCIGLIISFLVILLIINRFRVVSEYCGGDVETLLEEGKYLVQDLQIVLSHVSKCFNPSYDIISFYLREYHRQFFSILSSMSKRADDFTAHQIISLGMFSICVS